MANYPGSASTDANLFVAVNNKSTTLNGALTSSGDNTSGSGIAVASTAGFPTAGYITIDTEAIAYTGISGNNFTGITRGADGTTATSHSNGVAVFHNIVAAHHNVLKDEIKAVESDQLSSTGIPALKSTNILINGGFDFWQRGTSFSNPANNQYVIDRWRLEADTAIPTSATISQETTNTDASAFSAKILVTTVGSCTRYFLFQRLENFAEFANRTITLSIRVKTTIANKVRAYIDSSGAQYSAYHSGSGNWETLTVTLTVPSSPTYIDIAFGFVDNGNVTAGTVYVDNAMLVFGSNAVSFLPKDHQLELAQCMRYFQTELFDSNRISPLWYNNPNDYFYYCIYFKVPMRVTPTMTYNGGSSMTTSEYSFPSQGTNSAAGPSITLTYPGGGSPNFSSGYTSVAHQTTYNLFSIGTGYSWTADAEI